MFRLKTHSAERPTCQCDYWLKQSVKYWSLIFIWYTVHAQCCGDSWRVIGSKPTCRDLHILTSCSNFVRLGEENKMKKSQSSSSFHVRPHIHPNSHDSRLIPPPSPVNLTTPTPDLRPKHTHIHPSPTQTLAWNVRTPLPLHVLVVKVRWVHGLKKKLKINKCSRQILCFSPKVFQRWKCISFNIQQ